MAESSGEAQQRDRMAMRESVCVESAERGSETDAQTVAAQPPSRAGVATAAIRSTKGSYEENPLLGITQPTSAPNNTPVQTAPASPVGGCANAQGTASVVGDSGGLGAGDPPALLPPASLEAPGACQVSEDDGGKQPPRVARDHVGERSITATKEDDNSPISIMSRRQIFSTSDSRCSGSPQEVAGPPGATRCASEERGSAEEKKSGEESDGGGVAPHSFYFDKDRSVTDPHVRHDQDEKINISSWLKSRQGAEVYALSDSAGNGKSSGSSRPGGMAGSKDGDGFSIHDGLISPQAPRSALSIGSSCGRVMSRDSMSEDLSTKDTRDKEEEEENYVPPPPPKFINSKLDGVRSRLLLNPRVTPPKIDADMGTASAAAVLSNMRSSPFNFPERTHQYSSRPGSSSFSKSYPRPIIRIHHREHSAAENDENAVLDGDDDDDEEDAGGSVKQEDLNGVVKTTGERLRKNSLLSDQAERQVTWNKNGKRINRRLTAGGSRNKRLKKPHVQGKGRSRGSHGDDDGNRVSDDGDESYTLNDYHDEDDEEDEDSSAKSESKASRQKAGMGSRSRTGCWICRLRKKKCTEERPSCFNCERLNLECHYDAVKPDFVSDPKKKMLKLLEIKTKTKEAKRNAMRKKPSKVNT